MSGKNFCKFVNKYLVRDVIFWKNINNREWVLWFDSVVVRMSLSNLNSMADEWIVWNIWFLEDLVGMRVLVEEFTKNVYGDNWNVSLKSVLWNDKLYNFLLYLFVVFNPINMKWEGVCGYQKYSNGLILYIVKDKWVFYLNEIERGLDFDLIIEFFVKNFNVDDLIYCLRTFGLGWVVKKRIQ